MSVTENDNTMTNDRTGNCIASCASNSSFDALLSQPGHNIDENSANESTKFKMPRALPHVYSCFTKNLTDYPVDVTLEWYGRPNEHEFDELNHFTLQSKEEKHTQRKIFQPDLPKNPGEEFDHDNDSYCSWIKILHRVTVEQKGEFNKNRMEIIYPFDNVHSPMRNWEFHVTDTKIESRTPTRIVNILKYQNLTDIEK